MTTPVTIVECAPPGVSIVGEMTADGQSILMIGVGPMEGISRAAAQLPLLTADWTDTDPPGGILMPLSWPACVQLAFTYGSAWRPGPVLTEWIATELLKRTGWADRKLPYVLPAGLKPYFWQEDGARMLMAHGVFLEDDPGTGKTITTILGMANREYDTPVTPAVIVVPPSTIDQWTEAFELWAPHWKTIAWRGTKAKRQKLVGTADVYVVGYDLCSRDAGPNMDGLDAPLLLINPVVVCADEAHYIKNPLAVRSLAVRRLARGCKVFIPLTGTPITHTAVDMWPALSALEPEALPSGERYETRYIQKTNNDYNEKVVGLNPFRETEFRTILLGRTRRVAKADVLKFLPAKQHSVRTVVLPPEWRKAYDDIESKMLAELPDSGELSAVSVLTQLTRLSQLASAPATVEVIPKWDEAKGEWKDHQHVELRAPSWKVTELLNVLAERPGKPTVCFAVSRQLIMLAGTAALAAGLKVGYIVGGQTPKVRTANREAFQRGELDVICVTAAAGGTGLNLTAADTAVFLQRPWSLVDAMQAEDRIHRIGSEIHTSISIIDIVAEATVDSRIRAVLRQKAGHLGELLQDPRIVAQLLGGASVTRMKAKAS